MIVRPSAEPSLPEQVAAALEVNTDLRFGTVVSRDAASGMLAVNVGGGLVSASRVMSYEPIIGDHVAVLRQEASWLVLGSMAGSIADVSAVSNASFEDGDVGALPPSWQLVTTAGSPTLTTAAWGRDDVIDGPQVGRLTAGSTATITCEVVSDPISTVPGEAWSAAAWICATSDLGVTTAATVELRMGWYSNPTLGALVGEDSSGVYAVTRGVGWRPIRAAGSYGYAAPAGASYMRVKLAFSWSATAGEAINFDRILARRVS